MRIAVAVVFAACTHSPGNAPADAAIDATAPSDAAAATPHCTGTDPLVADPTGVHGLYAFPGSDPAQYVLDADEICGGDLYVDWSAVDKGSGDYVWTSIEDQIAVWTSVGKRANLLVEAVGFGAQNAVTPSYVLADPNVAQVSCAQTANVPVFWSSAYESYYKMFIAAVLAHYGSDSRIGYIRFGMSNGAQSGTTVCYDQLVTAGLTEQVWQDYIAIMAPYEAGLPHTVQVMLALGPYGDGTSQTFPDWEAQEAVSLGLGIGNQGLSAADITNYNAGVACHGGDWCANFASSSYVGKVPFYIQQIGASCPDGSCSTGSLTTLYPFAASLHTQVFEVYTSDLSIAYNSTDPQYAQYGSAYRDLFTSLAATVGSAP